MLLPLICKKSGTTAACDKVNAVRDVNTLLLPMMMPGELRVLFTHACSGKQLPTAFNLHPTGPLLPRCTSLAHFSLARPVPQFISYPIYLWKEKFIEKEVEEPESEEEEEEATAAGEEGAGGAKAAEVEEEGKVEEVKPKKAKKERAKKKVKEAAHEWELLNKQKPIW